MEKIDVYVHILLPKFYCEMLKINPNIPKEIPFINNEVLTDLKVRRNTTIKDVKQIISYVNVNPEDVLQEYRRQKIATKLLELVERNTKENGAKIINLDTYKRLPGAINLYKKFGFKIVPQFPELKDSYYSVCMSKEIK